MSAPNVLDINPASLAVTVESNPALTEPTPTSSTSTPSPPTPSLDPAELSKRVLKQVEFYFSDSNLPKDNFLRGLYDADENHWVDLSVIESFKRMRAFGPIPSLTSILSTSSFLKLSPDGLKVTRVTPLPSTIDTDPMTTLTRGWHAASANIDFISAFFTQLLNDDSAVRSVRMRKDGRDHQPDGSAWVEFSTAELAEKVAAEGPYQYRVTKTTVEGGKEEEVVTIKTKPEGDSTVPPQATMATGTDSEGKEMTTEEVEGEVTVEMKAAVLPQLKDSSRGTKRKADTRPSSSTDDSVKKEEKEEEEEEEPIDPDADRTFTPDVLIRFDTVNVAATTRESLRALVEGVGGEVVFVDYSKGEDTAVVRLGEGGQVKAGEAVKKLKEEGKELDGVKVEFRAMDGEEEGVYWRAVWKQMRDVKEKREKEKRGGKGRGRGGRGGWGGKRGRGGGRGGGGRGGGRGKRQRT